jgi:hypothetical protein
VRVICEMFDIALHRLREGYVAGLLLGLRSIRDMVAAGLLDFGLTHRCRLRKLDELDAAWCER